MGAGGSFPLDFCMHARTVFPVSPKFSGTGCFVLFVSFLCHVYSCLLGRARGLRLGQCASGIEPGSPHRKSRIAGAEVRLRGIDFSIAQTVTMTETVLGATTFTTSTSSRNHVLGRYMRSRVASSN